MTEQPKGETLGANGRNREWYKQEEPEVVECIGHEFQWFPAANRLVVVRRIFRSDNTQAWYRVALDGNLITGRVEALKLLCKVIDHWCQQRFGGEEGRGEVEHNDNT